VDSLLLSSGDALAATKIAEANRTATETVSGAYLKAQQLKAEGITEAGKIRKEAYSKDPAFYLWYRSWLTKQRIWDRSKPETIFQTGAEEYNKFGGTEK
jgi:regulator of protease activity HflC (stomatin/prohibitin superfamily)